MPVYWMAYRIKEDDPTEGLGERARTDALLAVVKRMSSSVWNEIPNVVIFRCRIGIEIIAEACEAAINPDYDFVLIRRENSRSVIAMGSSANNIDTLNGFWSGFRFLR